MRLFTSCLFAILVLPILKARPLSFEQRSPGQFVARFGATHAVFHGGAFELGPISLRFSGSSECVRLEGDGKISPSTYILPGFKQTFSQYPRLALRNLYPGVDAIFYGNGDHLEYDLVAAPHFRLENIQLIFEGADDVRLNQDGALRIESGSGVLEQQLPRVFQADGREVAAHYVLLPGKRVGIRLGPHNARLGLTIDPVLSYTRYFGGSGSDSATHITTDAQGNLYIAGSSNSVNFPTTNGFQPKLNPPLQVLSNAGQTVTRLPVGEEESVISIAGTSDGAVIYALTPDALYVTSNQGATWQQRPSPFQNIISQTTPNLTSANQVNYFAVDPIDPSQVFLATSRGLLSSGTGGLQGWGLNESGLPVGGNGSVDATWVTVSPLDHLTIYATTGQPGGLFKTTNHGVSWQTLNPQVPGEAANTLFPPVAALAANGTDLYVVDSFSNLLKSADGGATWQELAQQLYGARMIALDPNAPNVYIIDAAGLQVSNDGGQTFTAVTLSSMATLTAQQLTVDPATGALYVGQSSSILVSTDAGKTFQQVQAAAPNLHALAALGGQVYAGVDSPYVPFVMKLDPTGTQILYSTFIGGSLGDTINGIAVDAQGNCTVSGATLSPDYPATVNIGSESPGAGFVTKLSADGTQLIYSMVLHASKGSAVQGLALDSSGAAYITGQTPSPDFPTTVNAVEPAVPTSTCRRPSSNPLTSPNLGTNAFVSKLTADGSALTYSTFLTGSCGSNGLGIALDAAGEAIVVGYTTSTDFPATQNAYQPAFPGMTSPPIPPNTLDAGFVTKLSAAGDKILSSSYLGGGSLTQANAVTVDTAGNIALTGATNGMALGATPGAYQQNWADRCEPTFSIGPSLPQYPTTDAFVLKLDPTLSTAQYLTYLGGGCSDSGAGIALDAAGNAWIVGTSESQDLPMKSPYQGQGIASGFVSELNPNGSQLLFSSWTDGVSLALDAAGAAYLAGVAASVNSVPKVAQGTTVEVLKIDPSITPAVVVDGISAVTGYPPALLPPFAGGIAPGQLIQINGRNLGPARPVIGQVDATGRLATAVGNTSVFFDDVPAPLLSVGATSIECFAPFEISRTTNVTVVSNGQKSNAVRLGVTNTAPQILSVTNQDGTPNSASNAAHVGSTIVIYASGLGETSPLSVDGLVNSAPLPVPLFVVSVFLPGVQVQPQFLGAAPGMIAGIVQVNVQLPVMNYPVSPQAASVSLNGASAPVYVSQ